MVIAYVKSKGKFRNIQQYFQENISNRKTLSLF